MSLAERRLLAREATISTALAASLAALLLWATPPGIDWAAHAYQRTFLLQHGFAIWNNFWYAGRYSFVTYSLLYYPLAAVLGIRVLRRRRIRVQHGCLPPVGRGVAALEPVVRRPLGRDRRRRRLPVRARHLV